jgi:TonB-linked SusC/RagA family outer membrane protein
VLSAVSNQPSGLSNQSSALNRRLPTQYPHTPNTYKRIPLILIILVFVSCGAAMAQEHGVHTAPAAQAETISGVVVDAETGEPLVGATIRIKDTAISSKSDRNGAFILPIKYQDAVLEIVFIGFLTKEVFAKDGAEIILFKSESRLDEVQVIAYGTTTKRLNTGSVGRVDAEEISKQPVSNVLEALSGRIPGLTAVQSSGTSGSSFTMQIRGRNSITQGSEPLILIDGVPFASGNENINSISSSIGNSYEGGGLSPFSGINPSDIESIEVLKDADATAIYGSRGANGVILITTKKGRVGRTQITANINQGFTQAQKSMKLMATEQYLEMRQEAFHNSGVIPTIHNAPDLNTWDRNRYTDLKKELIGNVGQVNNAQVSLSGGNNETQFILGGGYHRETDIFPGKFPSKRTSLNFNLNHLFNKRLNIVFSGNYIASSNKATGQDLTYFTFLPPNNPSFYDEYGNLKWEENGVQYENPYRYLFNKYDASTRNLMGAFNLNYNLTRSLSIKGIMGYNILDNQDKKLFPEASRPPTEDLPSSSQFGTRQYKSWSIEPYVEYNEQIGIGKLSALAGGTFQERITTGSFIEVRGFPSDILMESMQAASTVVAKSNSYSQYRYQALFGRLNYNIKDKYLFNLTGRRDGSSRFGPQQRYANFGALGAAWIFSEEKIIGTSSFLTFGKIRSSYGITGNDQIGDYQYLDSWISSTGYQESASLRPSNLFNPQYGWEENRKLEVAFELGFLQNRLLIDGTYYNNRSDNQLILYNLPYLAGFGGITNNLPALVENKGWEFQLNYIVSKSDKFIWNSNFNLTLPKNTLVNFPDIESSNYASQYVVGKSLNSIYGYKTLGVDPETGLYHYSDLDGNSILTTADYVILGKLDPISYGGFRNNIRFRNIELDIFFDYKKQSGRNYLFSIYQRSRTPGTFNNQPIKVLERWQNEGDKTDIEKFTSSPNRNVANLTRSDAGYDDQSFLRLRSLHLNYNFPEKVLSVAKAKSINVYFQGQNLFMWNKERGYDPEVQDIYRLAPLRTYTFGIQITY